MYTDFKIQTCKYFTTPNGIVKLHSDFLFTWLYCWLNVLKVVWDEVLPLDKDSVFMEKSVPSLGVEHN